MSTLTPDAAVLLARASLAAVALPLAAVMGEIPARLLGLRVALSRGQEGLATLARRLNRPERGVATLVYRGLVLTTLVLAAALVCGWGLARVSAATPLVAVALLTLWFGHVLAPAAGWRLWQRARAETTPLQLPGISYLFADSHAVLRYSITQRAEAFAVCLVGASLGYVLGGFMLMVGYLALAAAHAQFHGRAFGWAAQRLFAVVDAVPRVLSRSLLFVAALFVPGAHPWAIWQRNWRAGVADMLRISLGGPMPGGEQAWVGAGTARLTSMHLRRALLLLAVATLLLAWALAATRYANAL